MMLAVYIVSGWLSCGVIVGLGLGWMIRHTHGPEGN